ncbi:hypothetical protein L596_027162 [Steinernema carpocapsae]|uniref:Uncharacterized protein n=1 Tax=Steinernema carpocapsae TaxID=34508 RepID=A0A4U5M3I5_STECR|nr:hypothetical protein L596_027162 [Steinernema carpocapsae]
MISIGRHAKSREAIGQKKRMICFKKRYKFGVSTNVPKIMEDQKQGNLFSHFTKSILHLSAWAPTPSTVSFNGDVSSVSFCHHEGASVYNLKATDPVLLSEIYELPQTMTNPNMLIADRIMTSNYLFLVCQQFPTNLMVYDVKRNTVHKTINFAYPIRAIKHNSQRIAVCSDYNLQICALKEVKLLHTIPLNRYNTPGLFDLNFLDPSLVAYPTAVPGQICLFDAVNLKLVRVIKAHQTGVTALKLSIDGSLLATASNKGTVIRVTSTKTGETLFNFCRSLMREAEVCSLCFSPDNHFLVSSSRTGTVHLFQLRNTTSTRPFLLFLRIWA